MTILSDDTFRLVDAIARNAGPIFGSRLYYHFNGGYGEDNSVDIGAWMDIADGLVYLNSIGVIERWPEYETDVWAAKFRLSKKGNEIYVHDMMEEI